MFILYETKLRLVSMHICCIDVSYQWERRLALIDTFEATDHKEHYNESFKSATVYFRIAGIIPDDWVVLETE